MSWGANGLDGFSSNTGIINFLFDCNCGVMKKIILVVLILLRHMQYIRRCYIRLLPRRIDWLLQSNPPPFVNAGGKSAVVAAGSWISMRYEIQGQVILPKYKDNANNLYEVELSHNGGLQSSCQLGR